MQKKSAMSFLALLLIAVVFMGINYFLWSLKEEKEVSIAGLAEQVALREKQNQQLENRNMSLLNKVVELQSDDAYVAYEAKVREDYGMIGSNETPFVLTPSEIASIPDIPGLDDFLKNNGDYHYFHQLDEKQNSTFLNQQDEADQSAKAINGGLQLESFQ